MIMAESISRELLSVSTMFISRSAEDEWNLLEMTKMVSWQNYSCLSAFTLLAWDHALTFADEVSLIWSQPSNPSKFLFLVIRYFGLALQLANFVLSITRFSHLPVSHTACAGWYAFEAVRFWVVYAPSDIVLMMRVYDLYQQSHRIGFGLVLLHVAETLVVSICCWHTLDYARFDPICNSAYSVPREAIAIVVTIIFSQFILWALTFIKRDVGRGRKRTSLTAILGDGIWSWLIILTMLMVIVPTAFVHQFVWPHLIFFSWPPTILSVGTCRLLLNTAKQSRAEQERTQERWELDPRIRIDYRSRSSQQQRIPQKQPQAIPEVQVVLKNRSSNPMVPVSSHGHHTSGHHTSISYVSSRQGLSLYPTMFGDSNASHHSVTTAMTSLAEESSQNTSIQLGGGGDIEIGSLHASSSLNSEEMRRFWNEP
ncbi:hypothetical protein GALMADRAFT_154297 [Galerina marginata CBS 339.88]|uniref:DUF6533 domain-containing protein n=1 Tax=Galerina marginata (strain CBS 339.88) TaxID=685588 RepID=A0A067THK6_GALM3|nr:hypothetical protein GALMADRAFT_154297 [Galerina marginata CBS 339.88]